MGETPQAAEFGAALREMRLAYDRTIADAAADLRIRQVYLVAIEDGRFDDLPGPTYALGFVRAYATYLGLDVAEVVKRYRAATSDAVSSTHAALVPPSPAAEGGRPTGSVLLVAAVLALVAYGGWYYLSIDGRDAGSMVAGLPQRLAALVGMRGEPPPPARKTPAPAPQSAVPAQGAAAPSQAAPDSRTDAAMQAATDDTAAPLPSPATPAAEPEAAPGTTSLGAREDGAQGDAAEPAAPESPPPVAASETPPEVAVTEAPAAPEPEATPATEATVAPEPEAVTATEATAAPEPEAVIVTDTQAAPEPEAVTVTEATAAPEPEAVTVTATQAASEPPAVSVTATQAASEPPAVAATATPVVHVPHPAPVAEAAATPEPQATAVTEAPPVPAAAEATPPTAAAAPEPRAITVTEPQAITGPVATEPAAGAAPPTVIAAAPTPPAAPVTPAARPSRPAPLLPLRVVLRATARSWVEVNEGPDKAVFARLMYPGDIFEVPPRPGFTMSTGNAGGVQIFINGELLPPLGPLGAVRRDVALEAETLLRNAGAAR